MKKILLITLLLLFNISFAEFTDLPQEHWAYNAVNKMQKSGVLSGYPDGSFKPSKNITLAEFSTIFANFFKVPTDVETNFFIDVDANHWAKNKIEAVRKYIDPDYNSIAESFEHYDYISASGITADMPVTREIVIYSLFNIFGYDKSLYKEGEEKELFADWEDIIFPEVVCIAYKNGVVSGEIVEGKVYISPQRYITRAEISAMFNNLLGYNDEITNREGFNVLEVVLNKTLKLVEDKKYNEVTEYLYDTKCVLKNIDFSKVIDGDLEKIVDMYHENFTYDIRSHGFYEYNHAYLNIETYELNMDNFLESLDINYDDLTTEKLQQKIDNYNFRKIDRFYREGNSRTIEFIKIDDEWKIKL